MIRQIAMKQFSQLKSGYPATVLLFLIGDHVDAYFEDAQTVASTRGVPILRNEELPTVRFSPAEMDLHLRTLVRQGKRVAICERAEQDQ